MQSTHILCLLLLSLLLIYSASGQTVTQSSSVVTDEGKEATLSCEYSQTSNTMFWYVHKPGQTLNMLLRDYSKKEELEEEYKGRLFYSNDKTSRKFPLNITSVKVSDSGTYYCVFSDSGSGYKYVFGQGTKLQIIPKTERTDPSVYKLKSSKQGEGLPNSVCLVTDFPNPQTNLKVDGIESSLNVTAVLDKSTNDVWRYSTVVWDNNNDVKCRVQYGDGLELPPISDPENAEETCSSLSTDASFRTNPSLNTLSQTVLGWRALTAKAIIFNLIITFRLWSS